VFRSLQEWTLGLRILLDVGLLPTHLVLTFRVAKTAKLFDTKFSVNKKIISLIKGLKYDYPGIPPTSI